MDFGAGAARTGVAHFPEVGVSIETHDAVIREAGHVLPNLPGFVIVLVHGRKQAFLRELPNFSQKFPGPGDSFFLVVVAEAPVTEHFEEGVVVVVAAHHVEVVVLTGHAEALLAVACALPALGIVAQENRLELVHARVREHERRVVMRDHRRRTHKEVALGFKELDERFAHLRRSHSRHNVSLLIFSGNNIEKCRLYHLRLFRVGEVFHLFQKLFWAYFLICQF